MKYLPNDNCPTIAEVNTMKKKNENSQQQKKGINATLLLPKNDFFPKDDGLSRIEIYMSATPDNWSKLYYLGNDIEGLQYLGTLIFHHAIRPGYERYASSLDNPPPRGIHAVDTGDPKDGTEAEFMADSRNYIAAAVTVISYWINKPEDEWPEFFNKIITDLKSSKVDIHHKRRKTQLVATKITFAIWKKKFKSRMIKQGLSGPKDLKSFRRRYINDNPRVLETKILFEKNGPYTTIEDIVGSFPEKSKFSIARPSIKFAKAHYSIKTSKIT